MLEGGAMVEQFCINEHITVEQFESDLQILERSSLIYMRNMARMHSYGKIKIVCNCLIEKTQLKTDD